MYALRSSYRGELSHRKQLNRGQVTLTPLACGCKKLAGIVISKCLYGDQHIFNMVLDTNEVDLRTIIFLLQQKEIVLYKALTPEGYDLNTIKKKRKGKRNKTKTTKNNNKAAPKCNHL